MTITVDFSDGSYLLVDKFGDYCVYEDIQTDFQGNLRDTLKILPEDKKQEITQGLLRINSLSLGGKYNGNTGSVKALNWG